MRSEEMQSLLGSLRERLEKKADDLAAISATGYSFEGWVKWEAYCAWKGHRGKIAVEQRYPGSGPDYRPLCDVVLTPPSDATPKGDGWIELAVVHDWTSGKWISKISDDVEKLRRAELSGAVVVLCAKNENSKAYDDEDARSKAWFRFFEELGRSVKGATFIPDGDQDRWSEKLVDGMRFAVFAIMP